MNNHIIAFFCTSIYFSVSFSNHAYGCLVYKILQSLHTLIDQYATRDEVGERLKYKVPKEKRGLKEMSNLNFFINFLYFATIDKHIRFLENSLNIIGEFITNQNCCNCK